MVLMDVQHGVQVGLAAIAVLQGLLLFGFGLLWKRIEKIDDKHMKIEEEILEHTGDTHAHGNGMPRGETEANLKLLSAQICTLDRELRNWRAEEKDTHREILERVELMIASLRNKKE